MTSIRTFASGFCFYRLKNKRSPCIKPILVFALLLVQVRAASAQDTAGSSLKGVVVEAFHSRALWKAVPAAVAIIGQKEVNRYDGASLVPVLNTVPGVRVEERSPSSYRLSVRGSLLRSPFGVRNTKVYWNNLPLSDAGGNTYLNLADLTQVSGIEVIKGPAASVYGAGTGGVVLLRSGSSYPDTSGSGATIGLTGGSYGLFREQAAWQYNSVNFHSSLSQVHRQSDGYRVQSATRKDAVTWSGGWHGKRSGLNFLLFYTDLYYQTPGGITLAQMEAEPRLARQPAGGLPGSVQQNAAVFNRTFYSGLSHQTALNANWSVNSFIMANTSRFSNPFITNFEKRKEQNAGTGAGIGYAKGGWQWRTGVEWLYNHSASDNFGNRGGVADTLQYSDNIFANQWFLYSQAQFTQDRWHITAGASFNNQYYRYSRLSEPLPGYHDKRIQAVFTPRVALSYRLASGIAVYGMVAKGFSPPALAELRPSDGQFHGQLNAEYGWNYEVGIKGDLPGGLRFDVSGYLFRLQNAIVRRSDAAGAEYFVNAGGTVQRGVEAMVQYTMVTRKAGMLRSIQIWTSYAFQPYRFRDYQQGSNNYSGNAVTGVPRHSWVTGADAIFSGNWYVNLSLNYTSRLPLTDANDVYAGAYQLLQAKAGYRFGKRWHVFAGTDNLLNEIYSLGNDINAAGRRYYNAAPARNFYAGVSVQLGGRPFNNASR